MIIRDTRVLIAIVILFFSVWISLGEQDKEFLFRSSKMQFDDAESFCKNEGGILYEPRNESVMSKVLNHAHNKSIKGFWLGVHDKSEEGNFVYASDETPITLKNWNEGEPNIYGNEDDCVNVFDGFWHDLPCYGYPMAFVCVRNSSGTNF